MELSPEEPIKKKRGRKKKSETIDSIDTAPEEKIPKKRGRKPKGGKLIVKPDDINDESNNITNIILHLKCSMDDMSSQNTKLSHYVNDPLQYNPLAPPTVTSYDNIVTNNFSVYDSIEPDIHTDTDHNELRVSEDTTCSLCKGLREPDTSEKCIEDTDSISMKDINMKLKEIKLQLYKSDYPDKKSACFWCTYAYDNPACYIPKHNLDNQMQGYGSFCRPECAAAYLMKENIDDSIKFERYHLLNQIYGKVYNFKKNIKPAPDPYYLLDKFYGNLSIQEYRKLLKSDHMLLVVDKPMTRILPELHEENEDFMNNYASGTANNTGVYKVKKQSEKKKGPSKSEIIKETFGL